MKTPQTEHHYKTFIFDSSRWEHYSPRDGDIFICTSYKAGTTWTQMICGLLIFQTPELPAPIGELSRWLDMLTNPIDDIISGYETQSHQRFIKTHTPLDGVPYYDNVHYIFCGRDPRDVFISTINHFDNMDMKQLASLLEKQGEEFSPPPPPPDNIDERFQHWMTTGVFDWEEDGAPFWSHFRHALTYWDFRHMPNIHFLHFADLKADLEGQMRRLADALSIEVPEDKWPALVKAATFSEMKANADVTAPDADQGVWQTNSQFFNKGSNEQWRGVLSDESLRLYDKLTRQRYPQDFIEWLERGSLEVGYPDRLAS